MGVFVISCLLFVLVSINRVSAGGLGQWSPVIEFPLVPVAAALLHDSGELLIWSAYLNDDFKIGVSGKTQTATFDPISEKIVSAEISITNHDMFCPGISLDFSGRVIVTGGDTAQKTSIFDAASNKWIAAADMVVARGYQSSATCSDGRIFTIGGGWSGSRNVLKNGEIYDTATGKWISLPGAVSKPMLTADKQGLFRSDNHAWLFGWKNNYVFQAGPSTAMNWYRTTDAGSQVTAGARAADADSMDGTATMFDALTGSILSAGGSPDYQDSKATALAHIIRIGDPPALAEATRINNMWFPRAFHNAVVLPDGTVFVSGGQSNAVPFSDETAILTPELFDPVSRKFSKMTPNTIPRTYHSIGILLPDARVFTGGGGLCGKCKTNHANAEIFSPPYLFDADGKTLQPRPGIYSVSASTIKVGGALEIRVKNSSVVSLSLVRMGSVTHTVNTDQRRVPLTSKKSTDGLIHYVTLPSDAGVLLPGYWMLFAIDDKGTPSIAKTLLITL